ncbi:MAG: hypothetical protein COC19_01965 [SAR86 cluster bacterium]|uniref:VanZ-like domain-containing protein n=1 Tax=SAR86 cluster bacterium TaxID=2030880 RepID=A0A2A4MTC0_9GAMM|nr:MAG: hypothetical protein COC19_01965 [SAR86 cluster bacterium]
MIKFVSLICRYWIVLSLGLVCIISFLSLSPLDRLPPGPGNDKLLHLLSYGLLMLPTALRRPKHWLFISILFVAYSGAIELIQPYVNRYGEWLDLAANTTGIVLAIILSQLYFLWLARR